MSRAFRTTCENALGLGRCRKRAVELHLFGHYWSAILCAKHAAESRARDADLMAAGDARRPTYLPILNPADPETRLLIEFAWILGETDPEVVRHWMAGRVKVMGAR